MPDPLSILIRQLETLMENLSSPEPDQYGPAAIRFLETSFDLNLLISKDPAWKARPELQRFIAQTQEEMSYLWIRFGKFHLDTVIIFDMDWQYDWPKKWKNVCRRWSCGRSVLDIYKDTPAFESFGYFHDKDEDLLMLYLFGTSEDAFSYEVDIPEGMPEHHWWWWLPKKEPPKEVLDFINQLR